jgi:hypothetical protein
MDDNDEKYNDQMLNMIIPNERVYIVDKSENQYWTLKESFHTKFVENLISTFGRVVISPGIYNVDETLNIFLRYINYKYAITIINDGNKYSDDENYVVLGFYDAIGMNLK